MILYSPIDLQVSVPDTELIIQFCIDNDLSKTIDVYQKGLGHNDITLALLYANIAKDEIEDPQKILDVFRKKSVASEETSTWLNNADILFPTLVNFVGLLPFKKITLIHAAMQRRKINMDIISTGLQSRNDPTQYAIQLTHHNMTSMQIGKDCSTFKSIKISKDHPCYALNNSAYFGFEWENVPQVHLIIYGLLDEEKHTELINRSITKFKEDVISWT